ncbi:MAG: rod shape-determining protein MreD [Desulfobulbaceae bacterium]|nr:rod shape-determining protein MreD [Desulfobulbaceae bacterium]
MLTIAFLLLGAAFLVIQTTIFPLLPEWMGKPDLLFLLVVFIAIRLDIFQGAVLALLFGLMMDIFSGVFLGLYPVIYLLLFFLLKGLAHHLVIDDTVHQAPLVAASSLFVNSGLFLMASILAPDSSLDWAWRDIILDTLILAVIAMPFYHFCTHFHCLVRQGIPKPTLTRSKTGNRFR